MNSQSCSPWRSWQANPPTKLEVAPHKPSLHDSGWSQLHPAWQLCMTSKEGRLLKSYNVILFSTFPKETVRIKQWLLWSLLLMLAESNLMRWTQRFAKIVCIYMTWESSIQSEARDICLRDADLSQSIVSFLEKWNSSVSFHVHWVLTLSMFIYFHDKE